MLPSCDRNVPGGTGGEGLTLTCPGETLALPGGSVPSALLTPLDSPGRSLEIESRGRALPFRGRGGDMCRSSERVSQSIRHDFRFSRGGEGEGPVAHLSWGSPAPSWGEGGGQPFSRLSTRPVVASKFKVAAEGCRSGTEVWMCHPDWNERRNRSMTIFIFEGSDGEGTDAHLLWGPRAPSSAGLGGRPFSAPDAARLAHSLPRKRKSRQSAAVLGMSWGRVSLTGTSDGIAPRRFSFSRGRTGKGLTLTCSGALVHRPRQDWADGPSQHSTRLDLPAHSLENENRSRALPFWE